MCHKENRMKKSTILLLVASAVFSLGGCKGKDKKSDNEIVVVPDKFIVKDGLSTYFIVNAREPQSKEVVAAQELNYFMRQATTVDIPIINEKEVKKDYHYISLGYTTQFKEACPDVDLSSIDNTLSSYYITTKGENIYIVSSDDYRGYGVLYGVYDLLNKLVDYTYYHDSEIYYEHKDSVNLLKYPDMFVKPTFDGRSISTLYTMNDDVHGQRLRLINNSRGPEWCRACYGHGHIQTFLAPWQIEPKTGETYGKLHPDWFINPAQPKPAGNIRGAMIDNGFCYTAGEELENYIAEKLKIFIDREPEAIYVMCAQEDTKYACTCERCQKALQEWGGTQAGLQINFMNHIIEKVEAWMKNAWPGREVQYLIYAYHPTLQPPVKDNGSGGYVPYSDKVKPHEKLRIFLAPIGANYSVDFDAPINKSVKQVLDGWSVVAKDQIMMYLYDLNYRIYFVNFNNFSSVTGMYRKCAEIGASYMLTQGVSDTNICCFDEMRSYVESNLMWDINRSYEDLADDFLQHFYKQTYKLMKDIYERVRDRYAYYQKMVQPSTGDLTGDLCNAELYPFGMVRKLDEDIKEAMAIIEPLKQTDLSLYETLSDRVMKEYLSVIYLKIKLYRNLYSEAEVNEMIETFEYYIQKFEITKQGEGFDINGIFG